MSRLWTWMALATACSPDPGESTELPTGPGNRAPLATILSLEPGLAGVDDTPVRLEAQVSDAEDAPQALVLRWESDRSGPLVVDAAPDADGFVSGVVDLVAGAHEITLVVEDTQGRTASDSATVTVGAITAPAVTILSPADQAFVRPGAVALEARVDDPDQEPATLTVRWSSDVDGPLSSAGPDASGRIVDEVSGLSLGAHVLTLTVTDADGLVGSDAASVTVDAAPGAPAVSIAPAEPRTVDDLVALVDVPGTDPEGEPVTHTFTWTRDGVAAGLTDTVPATDTAKEERWIVTVTASDPHGPGEASTAEVVIRNSPPSIVIADLSPQPLVTDSVALAGVLVDDPDDDAITLTVTWRVDGTPTGTSGLLLDGATWFDRGQQVAFEVVADDGTEATPVASAGPVLVVNSPPTAPDVRVEPALPVDTDELACVVDAPAWDADGDPIALTWAWDVDGVPFSGAVDTVAAADTAPLEVWTCAVVPDDGYEVGAAGVASVTICPDEPEVCDGIDNDCDGVIDGPGVCARRVFVTADPVTTDFGGALGADALCQAAADLAGLGGTWMAWVSDSTTSPAARFRRGSDDFVRLDGALLATSWSDLTDGALAAPIDVDEYGVAQGNHEVWTHTSTSGTALIGAPCDDWTNPSASAPNAEQGLAASTNGDWTSAYLQVCDRADDHLYCFEQ